MVLIKCYVSVLLLSAAFAASISTGNKEAIRSIRTGEELVAAVAQDCIIGEESIMTCLRQKVLSYVNNLLGIRTEFEGRGWSDDHIDSVIFKRLKKYVNSHDFQVRLPKFLFEEATLTFTPAKGLENFKVDFPKEHKNEDRALSEARGHLKKKLLLPLLLLLKLKIKALTPILLVIIGIKAMKAYITSKISLLLVIGFMLHQLLKKGGMSMPMAMMPAPVATDPPPMYGPPPTSPTYGPPAPTPEASYGSWEPTNNSNGNGNGNANPYARWDSHNIVYNAHQPETTTKSSQTLQPGI